MNTNTKISSAIAAILGTCSAGWVHAAPPTEPDADVGAISEIIVTAQRRSESMQNVPITIQAFTSESLKELNVSTFDDFVKYVPNVSVASNGPGQNNIYMRGLSIGAGGSQGTGQNTTQTPNVALYLDDESVSLPYHNLDVYAVDLERIEVIEGPQGTLFGSGAEAGVLRYITNKPKLNVTEGTVNAGYSYTAHGDPNTNVDATLNLPLIEDALAVRAVIYNDRRGGYINNLPATFVRSGTDEGLARYNNGIVPTNSSTINNYNIAANAINPVTYQGLRFSALGKIGDDWEILLTQSYQIMDAQGVFYQMPYASNGTTFAENGRPVGSQPLPPLSVTLFNPSYNKDKFENTSLTITGQIGPAKIVYTGSYLDRNIEQVQDYTNYARGVFGYYYQCAGYDGVSAAAGTCYSPSANWKDLQKNTHQSHELRVSSPDTARIRGTAGLYFERLVIDDNLSWNYKSVPTCTPDFNVNCFNNVGPRANEYASDSSVRGDNTGYFQDLQRVVKQQAAFASMDVDLIPHTLTMTLGTRYFRFDEDEVGGTVGSFNCKAFTPTTYFGPCVNPYGTNIDQQNPNRETFTGFRSRANLSYHITDDVLVYYTWSQGYRPGGFNPGSQCHLPDAAGVNQYCTPLTYAPDSLTNNELGVKSMWLNRRLQLNGTVYQEGWHHTQFGLFDPQGGLGNIGFDVNGADYRVRGGELQVVARITDGLTVQGSGSYNDARQTSSPFLVNNNPASAGYGQQITTINPFGAVGSRLAVSPELQWNMRIRDEIPFAGYSGFWQFGVQHIGTSLSATGNVPIYVLPGYTTYDASVGVSKDAWTAEAFAQNVTNVIQTTYTSTAQFIEAQTVTRPRIAGIKLSYKF
jgi:iron complex outermembrane recepter protein